MPPGPQITDVSPLSGYPGTQITITGTHFEAVQGSGFVWVGTVYATVVSWSDTQIVVTSNAGGNGIITDWLKDEVLP